MRVRIPDINGEEKYIEDKQSIVLIGANGAGKTRMSVWIDENNIDINIHRISAQKSLAMPKIVRPTELSVAEEKLLYGITNDNKDWLRSYGKKNNRWGNEPEVHMLNDFQALMEYLVTESYERSIEYREAHKTGQSDFDNETKLETIKEIWEEVITHRKLKICAGKIEVLNIDGSDVNYNSSEMSDGERAIFYFIAEVVCAKENSLIIIDEPENHLHKSILVRLWNAIEAARSDCVFLYITHSLEFARSRVNSQILWIKNMNAISDWDYELLDEKCFSDGLLLEILGNRQNVLLVEGTSDRSIDMKLYAKLFPEYNVIPLESCASVIQATKTYRNMPYLHYNNVKGIIDRDRRTEEEINSLRTQGVFVPNVAEIENLFLLPEVIRYVAKKQSQADIEGILGSVAHKTMEFLSSHIEEQALLFTRSRCQNTINQICSKKCTTVEEYKNSMAAISQNLNVDNIYAEARDELDSIIKSENYIDALKVINNKGLLAYTKLPDVFGWKCQFYIDYVLRMLYSSEDDAIELRSAFKQYIPLE